MSYFNRIVFEQTIIVAALLFIISTFGGLGGNRKLLCFANCGGRSCSAGHRTIRCR